MTRRRQAVVNEDEKTAIDAEIYAMKIAAEPTDIGSNNVTRSPGGTSITVPAVMVPAVKGAGIMFEEDIAVRNEPLLSGFMRRLTTDYDSRKRFGKKVKNAYKNNIGEEPGTRIGQNGLPHCVYNLDKPGVRDIFREVILRNVRHIPQRPRRPRRVDSMFS